MKEKCIIFGCGAVGRIAYYKLNQVYDIVAYADNNPDLWGQELKGIKILAPGELKDFYAKEMPQIIIAVTMYQPIYQQLKQMSLNSIIVWKYGLLYNCGNLGELYPIKYKNTFYFRKKQDELSVLFVQTTPCIRTNKIAKALKKLGVEVVLAYTEASPPENNKYYVDTYSYSYSIFTMDSFIDFVNKSDFDVVHSSNKPDVLTALLTYSNKPVVHDCHDLSSVYQSMTPDEMAVEYVANVKSNGVIYTTEGIRREAVKRFHLQKDKTFVLENLISKELSPDKRLPKLSAVDGQIHLVYEGGIKGNDKMCHRYFEEIWLKIVRAGVHLHFYSPSDYQYCQKLQELHPNLHFEGNFSSNELAVEMSKYDVGLCWLNTNEKNKQYLEFASPNKIQEYINAGIPVAVGNVKSQIEYVEGYGFGRFLDLAGDIVNQLKEIAEIEIPEHILETKKLTFEGKISGLIDFYNKVRGEKTEEDEKHSNI